MQQSNVLLDTDLLQAFAYDPSVLGYIFNRELVGRQCQTVIAGCVHLGVDAFASVEYFAEIFKDLRSSAVDSVVAVLRHTV
jgi:hypothetical protein